MPARAAPAAALAQAAAAERLTAGRASVKAPAAAASPDTLPPRSEVWVVQTGREKLEQCC
jgi:hypothetical protein